MFKSATIGEGSDGSYDNYDLRKVTYINMVFTAKFYLYGPIRDAKIITGMDINLFDFNTGFTSSGVSVGVSGATPGTQIVGATITGNYTIPHSMFTPHENPLGVTGLPAPLSYTGFTVELGKLGLTS
mgnify:CR=1 FL=1